MTEFKAVGSPQDVTNVNPFTAGFMGDLSKTIQGMQGAQDPLAAFMGALPGLFGQAISGANPYTQAAQAYANSVTPFAVRAALEPYSAENAYYSSGAAGAASTAAAQIQAQTAKDILGMQTELGGQLAGYGANLLGQQTGLLSNLMGYGAQLGAPEWWQPTYVEQNTPFGNFVDVLGSAAGIASMFVPGMQGLGLLGSSLGGGGRWNWPGGQTGQRYGPDMLAWARAGR